jgi:hypothetical protein
LFFVQELTFLKMEDSNSPLCLFGQNLVFLTLSVCIQTMVVVNCIHKHIMQHLWNGLVPRCGKKNVYVTDEIVRTGALNLVLGVLFSKLALKCCNSLISISLSLKKKLCCG